MAGDNQTPYENNDDKAPSLEGDPQQDQQGENETSPVSITELVPELPEVLEAVVGEKAQEAMEAISSLIIRKEVRGLSSPIPPADEMARYEQLVPGSAKRFIDDLFEEKSNEASHQPFKVLGEIRDFEELAKKKLLEKEAFKKVVPRKGLDKKTYCQIN